MAKSVFKSRDKIIGGALLFIIINAGLFYHFRRLECYFKPQPREKHLIWALIGASFLLFFFFPLLLNMWDQKNINNMYLCAKFI